MRIDGSAGQSRSPCGSCGKRMPSRSYGVTRVVKAAPRLGVSAHFAWARSSVYSVHEASAVSCSVLAPCRWTPPQRYVYVAFGGRSARTLTGRGAHDRTRGRVHEEDVLLRGDRPEVSVPRGLADERMALDDLRPRPPHAQHFQRGGREAAREAESLRRAGRQRDVDDAVGDIHARRVAVGQGETVGAHPRPAACGSTA